MFLLGRSWSLVDAGRRDAERRESVEGLTVASSGGAKLLQYSRKICTVLIYIAKDHYGSFVNTEILQRAEGERVSRLFIQVSSCSGLTKRRRTQDEEKREGNLVSVTE